MDKHLENFAGLIITELNQNLKDIINPAKTLSLEDPDNDPDNGSWLIPDEKSEYNTVFYYSKKYKYIGLSSIHILEALGFSLWIKFSNEEKFHPASNDIEDLSSSFLNTILRGYTSIFSEIIISMEKQKNEDLTGKSLRSILDKETLDSIEAIIS